MSQQHQTGKHKVGIRLFKDLERFCMKAPFFDGFEWQVRDSIDLNDMPGPGYLNIFEQPNFNLMFVPLPFCCTVVRNALAMAR